MVCLSRSSSSSICSGAAPVHPSISVVVKPLTLMVSVLGSFVAPAVTVTGSVLM